MKIKTDHWRTPGINLGIELYKVSCKTYNVTIHFPTISFDFVITY